MGRPAKEKVTADLSGGDNASKAAAGQLKSIVERIENLMEDREAVSGDIREVFAEAKGNGFNTKVLRALIRKRAMDKAERDEMEATLDLYESAVGL